MDPLPPPRRSMPVAALLPGSFVLLWSTGFIGARMGVPHADPLTFLFLRFLIAGGILFAVALTLRSTWPRDRAALSATLAVGVLIHGVYLGGVFWAIARGMPAGVAALIVALQPLMTAILAAPLLGERVGRAHWFGLGIGLAGLALVIGPKLEWTGTGITVATVGACVLSVLAIVLGSILQKAKGGATDLASGTCLQYAGGAVVVGIAAVASEPMRIDWTPQFVFALGWLVVVLSLGAVLIYYVLIRRGAVARLATLFYLVPPVTAVVAWALFGETLTPLQLVGMAVTVGGVAIATR
ncbi:threonine/homoserine efflux transporter RhtA [Tepidamorphus gemmatus]|uniref:Threonine/homoserine efflux transporter RhtA n=1 Tax=Tepidamorphus gemmatus TaxID=747076 RepID=A0A4R3MED0_9HYPH|nr:DMT family transporter [Tepidamorphus gemmatus]TCT10659.1 threonine/homoserine efflux transporter RhtA [Tepidamorphus gemmatus]